MSRAWTPAEHQAYRDLALAAQRFRRAQMRADRDYRRHQRQQRKETTPGKSSKEVESVPN
jgi:hypothetical protein